mmetsp:Transcript_23566/g.32984  ORF Transcript_23566/g.32984 Transcript_23566/m.32984 type:complete len:124 (-) Transcript_23566:230-601(-)
MPKEKSQKHGKKGGEAKKKEEPELTSLSSSLFTKSGESGKLASASKKTSKKQHMKKENATAVDAALRQNALTDLSIYLERQGAVIDNEELKHQLSSYAEKAMKRVDDTLEKMENQFERALGRQ